MHILTLLDLPSASVCEANSPELSFDEILPPPTSATSRGGCFAKETRSPFRRADKSVGGIVTYCLCKTR